MKKSIILLFACLFLSLASTAQTPYTIIENPAQERPVQMSATPDGNYVILTYSEPLPDSVELVLYKISPDASLIFEKHIYNPGFIYNGFVKEPRLIISADGSFTILYSREQDPISGLETLLIKLDAQGNELWQKNFECCFYDLLETSSGEILLGGYTNIGTQKDYRLKRLSAAGEEISNQDYFYQADNEVNEVEEGFHLSINPQGEIILAGPRGQAADDICHLRIDENEDLLSGTLCGTEGQADFFSDYTHLPDGGTMYISSYGIPEDFFYLAKIDATGSLVWEQEHQIGISYRRYNNLITWNGGAVAVGKVLNALTGVTDNGLITFFDGNGNIVNDIELIAETSVDELVSVLPAPEGGLIFMGQTQYFNDSGSQIAPFIFDTDAYGNVFNSFITGKIFVDENGDCAYQEGEQSASGQIVSIEGTEFYTSSLTEGNYTFGLAPGSYTLNASLFSPYAAACAENQTVELQENETVTLDFGQFAVIECPLLEVSHGSGVMRVCQEVEYNISYCNIGTATAENVYLEFTPAPELSFVSADIPHTESEGVFTFELPNLAEGECNQFDIKMFLDCDTDLGAAICTEVHIYPDSLCLNNELWSGGSIAMTATCDGDEVSFILENVGTGTTSALPFIIIEDQVVLNIGNTPPLLPGASEVYPVPVNGTTLTMISEQEPFHPGFSMPTASVENCGNMGNFGYVTAFPPDDRDYFIDIACSEALNSYDPNEKVAYPAGVGEEHILSPNTDLEYTLYFQNTGNDVAFNVRLSDTLSEHLDILSINPGASSHPYTWSMGNDRELQFFFTDINLPDSTSNPVESQGWVTYRIAQNADVPIGTVIENRAAIFFDFNPPIITNTVFHTIGEEFLLGEIVPVYSAPGVSVNISPNPFVRDIRYEISGLTLNRAYFELYDVRGQLLKRVRINQTEGTLQLPALPPGTYFLSLVNPESEKLWTAKLLHRSGG